MPLIQIVDENDVPLRGGTKQEAWTEGLFHRLVKVMIVDEKGRILLGHRAPTKHPFPGHWDTAVGGHVDDGETYEKAVLRELKEETGITDAALSEIEYYGTKKIAEGRKLNRFCKLFKATIDSSTTVVMDPEEVDEMRWFTLDEARTLLEDSDLKKTEGLERTLTKHFL